jgi:hypothetical protein
MAGAWTPQIVDPSGLVPISGSIAPLSVDLTITDVQPRDNWNPGGGDTVTITGSGFCAVLDSGTVATIEFDTQNCDLTSCDQTVMTCVTRSRACPDGCRRRELTTNIAASFSLMTITMGTVSATEDTSQGTGLGITLNATPMTIDSITPISASPILHNTLVLHVS